MDRENRTATGCYLPATPPSPSEKPVLQRHTDTSRQRNSHRSCLELKRLVGNHLTLVRLPCQSPPPYGAQPPALKVAHNSPHLRRRRRRPPMMPMKYSRLKPQASRARVPACTRTIRLGPNENHNLSRPWKDSRPRTSHRAASLVQARCLHKLCPVCPRRCLRIRSSPRQPRCHLLAIR